MKKTLNLFSSAASYRRHYFDGSPVSFFFNTRLELVGKMLEGTNAKKMLDIGCGPGVAFSAIVPNGVHYFGADSSKPMIEKCCELYHDNEFVHLALGQMEILPFVKAAFDVVLCMGVLEYVADKKSAISEVSRVVKPGGIVIISMLNKYSPYYLWEQHVLHNLQRVAGSIGIPVRRRVSHLDLIVESKLVKVIRQHKLDIIDLTYFDFNIFIPPFDKTFPRRSIRVNKRLVCFQKTSLRKIGTAFLIKGQKYH